MKDFNYALMLIKAGKYDGAREIFEELLPGDPQDKDILYNLGMCYSELSEPEKAVKTLSECVKHYPNYSNAYVALGFAHSMLGNNEQAKEYFLKACWDKLEKGEYDWAHLAYSIWPKRVENV